MLVFNLALIRTPKFAGRWFYVLILYTVVMTVIHGWMQWRGV
jgi:CDP-diacylglycerol--serine O-phosphatidyltransferase